MYCIVNDSICIGSKPGKLAYGIQSRDTIYSTCREKGVDSDEEGP